MKLYVASSWRNPRLDGVFAGLRAAGFECYDFRATNRSFNWAQIDPSWDRANPVLSAADNQRALRAPVALEAFANDHGGLDWADAGVLVMPCGRSAHLEAGYLLGQGKPVFILLADDERPDLMHLLAGPERIHTDLAGIVAQAASEDPGCIEEVADRA